MARAVYNVYWHIFHTGWGGGLWSDMARQKHIPFMQHSVARYQATKRRPSRSCFSIQPWSIDVWADL